MSKQERLKTAFQYLKSIGTVHTQKDVAEAMGASESNVSSAFKGVEKVLTDNFLNRFARTYGISLDWLLTGQGGMIIKKEASDNPIRGNVMRIGNISGVTNSPTTVNNNGGGGESAELMRVIAQQNEQIKAQHEQIQNLTEIIRRAKTGRLYSIKIEPEAAAIIQKYAGRTHLVNGLERYSDENSYLSRMNKRLKYLGCPRGKRGKILDKGLFPDLSTYWSRHTWATIAYEIGIPVDIIGQALGHSDRSHSVTFIYIKEDQGKVDEANRKVLDYIKKYRADHPDIKDSRRFCQSTSRNLGFLSVRPASVSSGLLLLLLL